MKKRVMKVSLGLVTLMLTAMVLTGQSMFMQDKGSEVPELEFRFLRPLYDGGDSLSFISGIYDLTLSIPFKGKSRTNWVVSIPFSYLHFSEDGYSESESDFGNLYLGVQQKLKPGATKGLIGSAGIFVPLASEESFALFFLGGVADRYRMYKYMPNTFTVCANLAYHQNWEKAFFKVEAGPDVLIPTKGNDIDLEILAHYGIGGGVYMGDFSLSAEFIGFAILTEDVCCGESRFENMLNFGVTWKKGRIRPGIFYMITLDKDFRDYLDGVIGIKVEVDLKK